MLEKLQKLLDRAESRISLWAILNGSGVLTAAGVTGWLSSAVEWISAYGAFGWWCAALAGALAAALVLLAVAWGRYAWIRGRTLHKWKNIVDNFNPMEDEFNKQRIRLADIANPFTMRISGKRFVNCDLIGPANIIIMSHNNLFHIGFIDCDIIVGRHGAIFKNAIGLENCTLVGGRIYGATIIIPNNLVHKFHNFGGIFGTLTGFPEFDDPQSQGTATRTQP